MQMFSSLESVLTSLESYCRIHSGTSNIYGVNEAQNFLLKILLDMNFNVELISNPEAKNSGELLWAHKFMHPQAPTILCISHADTLDGAELDQSRYSLERTQTRIVGQGVLDDKASQFVCLWGLQKFLSQNKNLPINIYFVSSPNEELGSYGFHNFFQNLSHKTDFVLGFEPALDGKNLVTSRRGNRWYDLLITGNEAHAGRAHHEGVNAAHELAFIISKLHNITNYRKNITVNVGEIKTSSSTYNVVCGSAEAKIDTRFSTLKDREEIHKKIMQILKKDFVPSRTNRQKAQKSWTIVDDCPPLHQDRLSQKWGLKYAQLIQNLENQEIVLGESGGGADICYFNRKGLIALDGLGACGAGMHRADEYVEIKSIESRSQAFAQFLSHVAREFKTS
jgi:glutamate carboxypeptidase